MTQVGQAKVYIKQGATEQVIDAGGYLNIVSGKIQLPGSLGQGYINLPLGDALEVSSADSLNALTSGTNPARNRINAGTDPKGRIVWSSGAGGADPVQWDVMPPTDLSSAGGMTAQFYAEVASGAVNGLVADVRFGVGDANAGATAALTSTPALLSISVASGDIIPNVPFSIAVGPASSTGTVSLYGGRVIYNRKTS